MGVSLMPDWLLMKIAPGFWGPIKKAADRHDRAYTVGGTEADKMAADWGLKCDLEACGHSRIARWFAAACMARGFKRFNYRSVD